MALVTGSMRPALYRLLLASTLLAGCRGCDDISSTDDDGQDASVDGGVPDAGPGRDPIPGERPSLSAPGEIVPLLWGRVVEARDELSGADQRFALDDPTQDLYQRFFGALNAACAADIAPEITAPGGGLVLPGCGQDGAYQARLHLCRADAASAFIAGEGAGIVGSESKPRLSLPERSNPGELLWSTQSKDSTVRASWAMLSVAELRESIAAASDALDPESCEALSDEHASLLAKALREASELLVARTQGAAGLLQQSRLDVHKDAVDDADTRTRVTRALNHSLLEQQKLYTGVPYAVFSPLDPVQENARSDRYPVLLSTDDETTQRAATLLLVSHTRLNDATSAPLSAEALASAFAHAMRAYEPKLFGGQSASEAPGVLSRLGLSLEELSAGARLLLQRQQLTGAPIAPEASLDVPNGLVHTYGADRAPNAYVEAITGARATRNDDKLSDYARRGLHHALEAARLAARRALERSALPGAAEADLRFVGAGSNGPIGSVRICEKAGAANVSRDFSEASLEFWQGELGAACAVDPSCDAEPYRVPESDDSQLGLDLSDKLEKGRYYVTQKGPSETRQIVASFSTALLDASDGERCYFVPLASAMHESMRGLHDRDAIPSVPRTPGAITLGTTLVSSDTAAVTTGFGRTLGGKDALGADLTLDLGEPLSTASLALTQALDAKCEPSDPLLASPEPRECGVPGLVRAQRFACRAQTLRDVSARSSLTLPGLTLILSTDADRRSLAILGWDHAHRAMAMLADLFDAGRCSQSLNTQVRSDALALLSELLAETDAGLPLLTAALEAEADAKAAAQNDPYRRRIDRVRALTGSSLASARLLLSPPLAAYEPSAALGQGGDPFDFALSRFPVVTRDAELAEDTRAESLLRVSRVQPWLADQTVQDGQIDRNAVASALNGPELAARLRTALVALNPEAYGSLPADAYGFLQALGIDNTQLRDAAVRIAQTAEIRGLSLLPERGSNPLTAKAMGAVFPAPQGHGLSALSGGKLAAATDALPHHFALRGHYHTLAYVQSALRRAVGLPGAGATLLSSLAGEVEDQVVIEQQGDTSIAVEHSIEVTVDGATSDADALLRYRLIFSDTGLSCSMTLSAGGEACAADAYASYASAVTTLWGAAGSLRRLRLSGFRIEQGAFDATLSRETRDGRIYVLDAGAKAGTLIASAALVAPGASVRHVVPRSAAFEQRVLELLAFKASGEGCAACRPRSVCETTRCELDVCVREAEANGKSCGASAVCESGECDAPGCGDGARSDGAGDVPYEACDDGNLADDDGCSSACLPELRSLEPVIEEGFPAGPASAIGVDGLGQQLLVYTADALVGDNQLIRVAALDSFGVMAGSERTIDAQIPRVFIADPCVAGLRDGGFAVVYGSPNIEGKAGLGVRIVSGGGSVGALLRVDDGNATAGTARVATVEDGFVVVWSERSGNALTSRVRVRRFDSQGSAIGASFGAGDAGIDIDQVEPNVIASLGQILVVWSERDADSSMGFGIRGRRFFPFGSPVDADAFSISSGDDGEAALTVLNSADYLVAFTSRDVDSAGDILRRKLQRFGLPLAAGDAVPWIDGAGADTGPVIAALGDDAVLAYQSGAPLPITALSASVADAAAADSLAAALAGARGRDVSAYSTPLGVWFVWSERKAQGRALFAYLLPAGQ